MVISPGVNFSMNFDVGQKQLSMRIDPGALARLLTGIIGAPAVKPLEMQPIQDFASPQARALRDLILLVVGQLGGADETLPSLVLTELEHGLMVAYLYGNATITTACWSSNRPRLRRGRSAASRNISKRIGTARSGWKTSRQRPVPARAASFARSGTVADFTHELCQANPIEALAAAVAIRRFNDNGKERRRRLRLRSCGTFQQGLLSGIRRIAVGDADANPIVIGGAACAGR